MSAVRHLTRGWLAAGIVLTTATQLRAAGPVGPGELMLLVWVLATTLPRLVDGRVVVTPLARVLGSFWAVAYVLLGLGWIAASVMGLQSPAAAHDAPAFLFTGLVVTAAALRPWAYDEIRGTAPWVMAFTVPPLLLLLAATIAVGPQVGPFLTFAGRFQGWAKNANAISLSLAAVPFVAAYLGAGARGAHRVWYALLGAGAVAVGVSTASDGLVVAWAGGVALVLLVWWVRAVSARRLPLGTAALAYVTVPAAVAAFGLLAGWQAWVALQEAVQSIYTDQGQGALRFALWWHAVEAAAASPLVGLGPGAHSGELGPFGTAEAHNTLLDWASCTGVLGVLALGGVLAWAAVSAWRSGRIALLAALAALVAFSLFHYVLRHPIFWFYVSYVAAASAQGDAGPLRAPAGGGAAAGPGGPGLAAAGASPRNGSG